jgi:hypothetical protein
MSQSDGMKVKTPRSNAEALSELHREFNIRTRMFPIWVKEGRLDEVTAQDRLDRLASAIECLTKAEGKL